MASSVSADISLSDSAKKKIPELEEIFEGIRGHKYSLEIVGVVIDAGSSEDKFTYTLAVTVKSDEPLTSNPIVTKSPPTPTKHSSRKSEATQHNIINMCFEDREQMFSKAYPADRAGLDNLEVKGTTVSSKFSKSASSPTPLFSDEEQVTTLSPIEEKDLGGSTSSISKNQHTFYHFMHGKSVESCPFVKEQSQNCDDDYQEEFACGLEGLLEEHKNKPLDKSYIFYIHDHLKSYCNSSPSCSKLWEYCVSNKMHSVLKYANEGLVLFSSLDQNTIGKVTTKYAKYKNSEKIIGHGASGKVYKFTNTLVVKEEQTRPLIISNITAFQQVTKLECKYVISLLEYIVGGCIDQDPNKRVFLSVMPYMNRRGLNEQFITHSCVLDYMVEFKDQEKCIFGNYIVMFSHVFEGLKYLHSKKIVHGDVKDKNILVHQECACESPLLCSCPYGGRVTYVLGDMGLFWIDKQLLSDRYVEWAKEKYGEPAGTDRMKASELYFTDQQGGKCGSTKVDIWAGGVTMMKALVGDGKINEATEEIEKYLESISFHSSSHVHNIGKARQLAKELKKELTSSGLTQSERLKGSKDYIETFNTIIQLLGKGNLLKHANWMSSYTHPERLPLPYILGAVQGANSLHKQCLDKLPEVHSTPLWKSMDKAMEIIKNSVRFLPEKRLDASEITEQLKDCSN